MKNLIFIIASLFCLTACQWNLDKFDLDGNVYNCEETCVNGLCDELKNECNCKEGWFNKNCDSKTETFEKYYNPNFKENGNLPIDGNIFIEEIEITNDGGYLIVGISNINMLTLWKLSSNGKMEWMKKYENEDNNILFGGAKIFKKDNDFYVVFVNDFLKIDSNGEIIWIKENFFDSIHIEKIKEFDNQLILIGSKLINLRVDFWLVKINFDGSIIEENSFGGEEHDYLVDIIEIDEGYLILGSSESADYKFNEVQKYTNIVLFRTDINLNILSYYVYGDQNHNFGMYLALTPDNNYLIGKRDIIFRSVYSFMKVDTQGNIIWNKNLNNSFEIVTTLNDGCSVLFDEIKSNNNLNFKLTKIDYNGILLWEKSYGSIEDEFLSDMKPTRDGGYIIVGSKGHNEIYLIKTDANGNV